MSLQWIHGFELLNVDPRNFLWWKKYILYTYILAFKIMFLVNLTTLYHPIPQTYIGGREPYSSICLSVLKFIQQQLMTLDIILNVTASNEERDCGSALCIPTSVGGSSTGRQYTSQCNKEGHKIMSPTRNRTEKYEWWSIGVGVWWKRTLKNWQLNGDKNSISPENNYEECN